MDFPMDFPGRFAAMRHGEVIANLGESSQAIDINQWFQQKPMTWGLLTYKLVPITPISLWFMVDITIVYYS